MGALLQLSGIVKSFAGVHALKGVSFDLQAGEVHALVGENGAGKSTLIKVITGAHQPDGGDVLLDGRRLTQLDPTRARALGIAVIYQQPALFPDLTVAENIALSLERPGPFHIIGWRKRRTQAAELLARVGARISPDSEVRRLSMPEQQLVEIAKALGANARLVIMDEPTASLSEREVEHLFRVIRELKQQGVGVIYISHRLDELFQVADRVTALRDGALVGTRSMAEVNRDDLIRMMVGRELSSVFPKREVPLGQTILQVSNLSCRAAGLSGIDLHVRRGEILGLAGLVGAGRTEMARVLFGITPADAGQVVIAGKPVRICSPSAAIQHGIAYVPEDRRQHGVILDMSVAANATLAVLRKIARAGWLNFAQEARLSREFVERLQVKTASLETPAGNLSGGNQQKVSLARWLATDPAVLILDEPTQGIDVGAKSEIHNLMCDLAAQGLGIIMISSELPEILGMSDRIAVLHAGRITGTLDRAAATQEKLLALALGHPLPTTGAA